MELRDVSDKLIVFRGDITQIQADAIVNAANSSLLGGGGVDGAIHRVGGPKILDECRAIVAREGHCRAGDAVITSGGNLPARYVIHTVGPIWQGGYDDEEQQLRNCYINSLQLAVSHGVKTIGFPNISTGAYGFPKKRAALIAIDVTRDFLAGNEKVEKVYFVCFDHENYNIYEDLLSQLIRQSANATRNNKLHGGAGTHF